MLADFFLFLAAMFFFGGVGIVICCLARDVRRKNKKEKVEKMWRVAEDREKERDRQRWIDEAFGPRR